MKYLLISCLILTSGFSQEITISMSKASIEHQISKQVMIKAYNRIKVEPIFIETSLENSLELANSGKTDGDVARVLLIKKKYKNLFEVPISINHVEAVAFSKKDFNIHKWKDLVPHKIAIIKGIKFIEAKTKGMDTVVTLSYKEAFSLLQKGKVDFIVIPKIFGLYNTHVKGFEKIEIVSPGLQKLDLYHFVHKKNKDLIPKLTTVLEIMHDTGEIKYIREEYLKRSLSI